MSVDQYGRRTWNVEDYQNKKKVHKEQPKSQTITNKSSSQIVYKNKLLKQSHSKDGFSCTVCNWTFKDTLSLINHMNSIEHLLKFTKFDDEESEMLDGVRRATVEEVERTMNGLLNRDKKDLKLRIERRKEIESKRQKKS